VTVSLKFQDKILTWGGKMLVDNDLARFAITTTTSPQDFTVYLGLPSSLVVDWGDGSSYDTYTTTGNVTHTYATAGSYKIRIRSGTVGRIAFGEDSCTPTLLTAVDRVISASLGLVSAYNMFNGCTNIASWAAGFFNAASANVTNFNSMFYGLPTFNEDLSGLDVSNGTTFAYMLRGCNVFNRDISGWNMSKAEYLHYMLYNCYQFNQNISGWNVSGAIKLHYMFYNCYAFNQDISFWEVNQVEDFTSMLQNCVSFKQNLENWTANNASALYVTMFAGTSINDPGTTTNLDKWYNRLANIITANSKTTSMGYAKYSYAGTSADDSTGKSHLVNTHSWTITSDGGEATCTFSDDGSGKLLATYASTQDRSTYSRIRFMTSNTLPTGLATGTDYWTIRVSSTTCKLATSLANAQAGTAIGYSDAGTGSHAGIPTGHVFTASNSSGKLLLTLTTGTDLNFSGRKVRVVSSTTLPTGLSAGTDYWLNRVSGLTYRITSTDPASAVLPTTDNLIAYTDAGTGTHELLMQPYPA
jgi:hypothetical protein